MFKDLFRFSDLLDVPVVVMLFFLAIFGLVLFRVFSRRHASHYEAMSQLPLDHEEEVVR